MPQSPKPTCEQTPKAEYTAHEVVALLQDEAEARAVAERCGLTLKSFAYGVATFACAEDAADFIARMENEPGAPVFSLNYIYGIAGQ